MHQGLIIVALLLISLGLNTEARAQLNPSGAIETYQKENPLDQEKKEQPPSAKKSIEPEIDEDYEEEQNQAQTDDDYNNDFIDKEVVQDKEKSAYQEELKRNAEQNKINSSENGKPTEDSGFELDLPNEEDQNIVHESIEPKTLGEQKEESRKQKPEITSDRIKSIKDRTNIEIEEDSYENLGTGRLTTKDYLLPYKQRRPLWTKEVEILYSQYDPINYIAKVNGVDLDFSQLYGDSNIPLSGISLELKRNFSFAAIGLGISYNYMKAEKEVNLFELNAPSLKLTLYLDTLFEEPYIVPYVSGGYSFFLYKEEIDDGTKVIINSGETDNFYWSAGLLFQLDWMDPQADNSAYTEAGIENTFAFVEARSYLSQGIRRNKETDPDLSSGIYWAAGVKIEF